MFSRPTGSESPAYAPIPVPMLEDDFSCDDFHPVLYELAVLKKSILLD